MTALGETHKPHSAEFKHEVVETALKKGISAAARTHNTAKDNISRWLIEAGHDPAKVAKVTTQQNNSASQAAVASRRAQIEQAKERLARGYVAIAELSVQRQLNILQIRDLDDERTDAALLPPGVRLSEIVGAGTRAIHDLQLLMGNDTERVAFRPSTEQVMTWRDELAIRRDAKQASGE